MVIQVLRITGNIRVIINGFLLALVPSDMHPSLGKLVVQLVRLNESFLLQKCDCDTHCVSVMVNLRRQTMRLSLKLDHSRSSAY